MLASLSAGISAAAAVVFVAAAVATAAALYGSGLAIFDAPEKLVLGLATGIALGFLLQSAASPSSMSS